MSSVATGEPPPNPTMPPELGVYRHFKGAGYELLHVARHSETEELVAVYCAIDDPETLWVRPLDMFTELVDSGAGPTPRFALWVPRKSRLPWPDLEASLKSVGRRVWRYGRLGLRVRSLAQSPVAPSSTRSAAGWESGRRQTTLTLQ
jgi:hypothetical protein